MEQKTQSAEPVEARCKCGRPVRHGQRNCSVCHAGAEKRRRLRLKYGVDRVQRALDHLTIHNPATEAAFNSKSSTKAVVICGQDGAPEIAGFVVGFLPEQMLKVLDDDGQVHVVPIASIQPDLGRTIYGRINQTELHTQDPS